jgi:hypothetical protein
MEAERQYFFHHCGSVKFGAGIEKVTQVRAHVLGTFFHGQVHGHREQVANFAVVILLPWEFLQT